MGPISSRHKSVTSSSFLLHLLLCIVEILNVTTMYNSIIINKIAKNTQKSQFLPHSLSELIHDGWHVVSHLCRCPERYSQPLKGKIKNDNGHLLTRLVESCCHDAILNLASCNSLSWLACLPSPCTN